MATFNQKDIASTLQPSKPNLQFDLQLLQAKESLYKANKKKVSELYGSILDSDVTRTDSQEKKDEFFKQISSDIKLLGSVDFSLDSNVDEAKNMFKSIYTNKHVLKDMVWTENFKNQLQAGQNLKGCIDPKKCNGQWWEEGDKYMAYKKQEFINASKGDMLNFSDVEYVPYIDITAKGLNIAKEKKISVKKDKVVGNYIVTTTNGVNGISAYTALFGASIGSDPSVKAMYKAKSYVDRMDGVYSLMQNGEAASFEEAQVKFYETKSDELDQKLQEKADVLNVERDYLKEKVDEYETAYKNGKLKENTPEWEKALEVKELYANSLRIEEYFDLADNAKLNMNRQSNLNFLNESYDTRAGINLMFDDITKVASAISNASEETELTESKFALEKMKFNNDVSLEQTKLANKKNYALWKKENNITDGDGDGDGTGTTPAKEEKSKNDRAAVANKADRAKGLVSSFNMNDEIKKQYKDIVGSELPANTKGFQAGSPEVTAYKKAVKGARIELIKLKRDANDVIINSKKRTMPLPYPEAVTQSQLSTPDLLSEEQKNQVDIWMEDSGLLDSHGAPIGKIGKNFIGSLKDGSLNKYLSEDLTIYGLWKIYKKNGDLQDVKDHLGLGE
jgi:hypothetical protein